MNHIPDILKNTQFRTFPEIVSYNIPGADYTGKSKKMFPHGLEARFKVLDDIDKFLSIVYYCGRKGYKFSYEEIEVSGIKGFGISISVRTKRQSTYLRKRFG